MKTFASPSKKRAWVRRYLSPGASFQPASVTPVRRAEIRHILHGPQLRAKLAIGAPDDAYEREADRVADAIMNKQVPGSGAELVPALRIEGTSQAKGRQAPAHEVSHDQETHIQDLRRGGHPLPTSARSFFEHRFGWDFGSVRIHNGQAAAELAEAFNARAYTVGQDIVFGPRQYAPDTTTGRELLAHELTHVIQQAVGGALAVRRQPDSDPRTDNNQWPAARSVGSDNVRLDWAKFELSTLSDADIGRLLSIYRPDHPDYRNTADKINDLEMEAKRRAKSFASARWGTFHWPVDGTIRSPFGRRKNATHPDRGYENHYGIDINGKLVGTPIKATTGGRVILVRMSESGYGIHVVIDHGERNGIRLITLYAHMQEATAIQGRVVGQDDVIGKVGQTGRVTGPHLHFEIRENRTKVNPLDYLKRKLPVMYLDRKLPKLFSDFEVRTPSAGAIRG